LFRFFESLLNAYPEQHPKPPPAQFVRFLWEVSDGVRGYMLAVTLLTAAIGAFEAILFALIGELVDWLAKGPSESFWQDHAGALLGLAALLIGSISLVCLQALFKYQSLYGNFPMRLRWNFTPSHALAKHGLLSG